MINILISTYNRKESLVRTVDSILRSDYKNIHIYIIVDGNGELQLNFPDMPIAIFRNEKRMDFVFSMNRLLKEMTDAEAILYASDDLEFPPHGISKAMATLKEHFPDGDGLIGIKQSCAGIDSAFGLVGRKFIERFPNRQIFCPDYIHYVSDREIGQFAKSINKFYFCKDVILKHNRPKDKTRELGLKVYGTDRAMRAKRVKKGLLWGRNFEKIGKK